MSTRPSLFSTFSSSSCVASSSSSSLTTPRRCSRTRLQGRATFVAHRDDDDDGVGDDDADKNHHKHHRHPHHHHQHYHRLRHHHTHPHHHRYHQDPSSVAIWLKPFGSSQGLRHGSSEGLEPVPVLIPGLVLASCGLRSPLTGRRNTSSIHKYRFSEAKHTRG